MPHIITAVAPDSVGSDLGLEPGDALLKINGETVVDLIDYQFLCCCDQIALTVVKRDGERLLLETDKDEDEPLGLSFEGDMLAPMRMCANKCEFCFVDQQPDGLRETLCVKDDDWRRSLLMGNYVTLTNVPDKEISRIIRRGASPLYISVHAMQGEVRARMMGNPRAARIRSQLDALARGGIRFHAQAVLCPGVNDGRVLHGTVRELMQLYPAALSLALVPVGLTAHRGELPAVERYDAPRAAALLDELAVWQKSCRAKLGTTFVYAADELYLLAGRAIPPAEEYDGYPQIENGVGLVRLLEEQYESAHAHADFSDCPNAGRAIRVATGVSFAPCLADMLKRLPVPGVSVRVQPIVNRFFGESVTVAGLLTARDLLEQLPRDTGEILLLTRGMLREQQEVFLDDMSFTEFQERYGGQVRVVDAGGDSLLAALAGWEE